MEIQQCEGCAYNDSKRCGVNFCIMPFCLYKTRRQQREEQQANDIWNAFIQRCKNGEIQAVKLYFDLLQRQAQGKKGESLPVQIIDDIPPSRIKKRE